MRTALLLLFFCFVILSVRGHFNTTFQKTSTGGAQCTSSADCGNGQGTCGSAGCFCWQGFTCPDCSRTCTGTWPSGCSNTCPEPIPIGGAKCKSCLDCFNCDGGTCESGFCKCYAGWTCSYCEWNTNNGAATCGGFSPKGKGSGKLSAGSIFGICFGGALALIIFACCFKGSIRDWSERRSLHADRAKRADLVAKAKQAGQQDINRSVLPRETTAIPQRPPMYPTDHAQMGHSQGYPHYSNPHPHVYAQQFIQPQPYPPDAWNTPRQMHGPPFQPAPYGHTHPYY